VHGDLGDDVRGGSEAIDPDSFALTCHPIRAVSDQAGAEQRRGMRIVVAVRQWKAEPGVSDGVLGVSP
jgi:hypothetical protein